MLGLPVRFTDAPSAEAREQGIFKHARGIIRGWELDPEEQARIDALPDGSEVVLKKRPLKIFIEVPTANDKLPRTNGEKIFVLTLCYKQWSLDKENKVPVKRYGFPIVPDFGGTAHAYCGDTLHACIGDLLKWFQISTLDQALRAYIIKSRVRDAANLLIAQPYSPMLMRQGVQPGPHLLWQALKKEITPKEAKKEWEKHEAQKATEQKAGSSWLDRITVPCRRCSDKHGEEVVKPLRGFLIPGTSAAKDVWHSYLAQGQDLQCFSCQRDQWVVSKKKDGEDPGKHAIYCDACNTPSPFEFFAAEDREAWQNFEHREAGFICLPCRNLKPRTGSDDCVKYRCHGRDCVAEEAKHRNCRKPLGDRHLPWNHFIRSELNAWKKNGTVESQALCARCSIKVHQDGHPEADAQCKIQDPNAEYACNACGKEKRLEEFDCVSIIACLLNKRRRSGDTMTCYDCHYPQCAICDVRPIHAIAHNSWVSKEDYFQRASVAHPRAAAAFAFFCCL